MECTTQRCPATHGTARCEHPAGHLGYHHGVERRHLTARFVVVALWSDASTVHPPPEFPEGPYAEEPLHA